MTMTLCDKCGKNITDEEKRYIVAQSCSKPNEKGQTKPTDWLMVKEVCMGCALEVEQLFNKGRCGR